MKARSRSNTAAARRPRGVALIIILAVLTILTILAATFTVMMQLESQTSNLQVELNSLDLLLDSGLNHAVAVLADMQATGQKVSTMRDDNLRLAFGDFSNGAEIRKADQEGRAGKWIPVLDSIGRIRGRYRVAIEDEAGKVNLNKAHMLEPSKGSAWDTGEVSLPHALGVPPQIVEQVVRYQYGPNSVPGARGDDDRNNVVLMADGLDNNANGLIDEDDEGVDDPGEYTPWQPMGDDRRFTTVSEAMGVILSAATDLPFEARNAVRREIPRRATLYSIDMCGSPTLPMDAPADINAVMGRECRTRLRTANRIAAFENVANRLDELAANVVDYRDENHVLTTVGGAYGVEAVNFNELLANDGTEGRDGTCTFIKQSYDSRTVAARIADKHAPFCAANLTRGCDSAWDIYENPDNLNYYAKYRSSYARRAVDIKMEDDNDRTRRIRILGPGKIKPSGGTINEGWTADDREVYDRYTLLRQGIGRYGPRTVSENPGFDTEPPAYKTFEWPPGFFINSYVSIAFTDPTRLTETTQSYMADPKVVKITDSTRDGVLTLEKAISRPLGASNRISRCIIWNWNVGDDGKCGLRGAITSWTFQGLQPRKYYLPVVNGWPRHYTPEKMGDMGFAPYEQIRSDSREHINHKWTYGGNGDDATPVRTSSHGYLDVFLRGGNTVSYKGEDTWSYSSVAWGFTFVRPEVIELINVSPRAISLRNWTLTFNTGSLANDIGTVQSASGYLLSGTRRDFNPVIPSNGYFYMVNNLKLFQAEFNGTPKKTWGGTAGESNPLWEIPSDAWGVQYRIDKAQQINRAGAPYVRVYVSGNENFRSDQFKGEVFEAKKLSGKAGTSDGTRYEIQGNGRNYIEFTRAGMQYNWQHYQPSGFDGTGADTIMILGMPAKGGLVSMTLKNEYKQIVSRTISYAYLNQDPPLWYGRSTEKVDPTHYSWVVRQRPSIGGKPNEARNASMRGTVKVPAFVKNGPLNSIAEIALVRKGEDFENVGVGVGVGTANRTIASLANSFGSSFIRLEAGDDAAERQGGWKVAADEVSSSSQGNVGAAIGGWEPGQWRGHTITFVTGDLRGESYPIVDNTQSGIDLRDKGSSQLPRSAPSQKQLRARKGDRFVLGPGYRSAACYSRRPNNAGEWLWRKKIPIPGKYNIYIFGLNDAINTTEFLEENYNASLDVFVWNYRSHSWDKLCERRKYGKEDGINAGTITPDNISVDGDFRLKLISHDVAETGLRDRPIDGMRTVRRRQTGYAWFNYALITPVPVLGRVNINTASARLLSALPGMSQQLAQNVYLGVDGTGRMTLKPYQRLGDILKVRGMTVPVFERCANMLCVDSQSFTVDVEAETIKDVNRNGTFDQDVDKVAAEKRRRYVVQAPHLLQEGQQTARIVEKYTP